ncbi:hypothetical protein EVU91_01165 [Macrococcoides bohemicum]|uniref:hypothetical protein n=1 Tax=Macrococcoides bohemicum TaxID=1903056 RepID=UPI00105A9DCF|nr:hypothetical protein [Macrococcus bohemicus]TDL40528.1 hypothetical protein EVU91_01165 [Macrococcus bohemicus]
MTILWTGKSTDMRTVYNAEGETYKEVYDNIVEKYGYDVFDEDVLAAFELIEVKEDDDYYNVISDSKSEYYYSDFEFEEEEEDDE